MGHNHHDHHHHHHGLDGTKLLISVVLNFSITVVQIIGGIISNSLSLLSDALHNLGDSMSLLIAYIANRIGHKKADYKNTFGYKRVEILAAFVNSAVLVGICIYLFVEAIERLLHPEAIQGGIMLIIATFGLAANLISVILLNKDKDKSINIKAAYLHLLGDTVSSFAVIAGGILMWKFRIYWLDSILTFALSLYIIKHAFVLLKDSVKILMQATPENIDLNAIKEHIEALDDIDNLHHVHIWKLDDEEIHFEAHLNLIRNISVKEMMAVRQDTEHILHEHFNIQHVTLQFGYNCCNGSHALIHEKIESH